MTHSRTFSHNFDDPPGGPHGRPEDFPFPPPGPFCSTSPGATAPLAPSLSALELLAADPTWGYDVPPPQAGLLGRTFQCCTSRPKMEVPVRRASDQPIWETADLTWWDFLRRRWRTLWLMKTIYDRLKECEAESEMLPPGPEQDLLWAECHRLNAREIREHAEQAKGFFIKAGQVMSSMVGVLPDAYTEEFLSLTDHLPVSTPEEVFRTIRLDLQRSPRDIFSSFDPVPIASASIAQVHKARLRSTGEVVAVKVQHEGVDRIFVEDCHTLTAVAGQVAFWSPDLDFRPIVEDMRDTLPLELDFREERRALERAGAVLRGAGNHCIVPRVHRRLFGAHVFVMEYVEATPIMDLANAEFCARHNLDKYAILRTLLDAFGITAFKDGLFHADPHAGNIRLVLDAGAPGGARPVLFDWGLFKEFTDDERLGVAKVFHSLANFDIAGLFDVLESLGFGFRPELLTDDFRREFLEKARSAMKDTVNRETARANVRTEMLEYKERLKKAAAGHGSQVQGSYSPIYFLEELPKCVIAFMRMLQILRGMCVAVDAEGMPVLQVLSHHAREALQEGAARQSLASRLRLRSGRGGRGGAEDVAAAAEDDAPDLLSIGPLPPAMEVAPDAALEARIQARLAQLLEAKQVVGAQVAVIQGGRLVCEACAGLLSTTDGRPVERQTRFPLLGATGGVAALALLRSLRRLAEQEGEKLGIAGPKEALRTPVARLWPQFGGGESSVTLADLLGHAAGLQDAFPGGFSARQLDDVAGMGAHLEHIKLASATEHRYAYLMQAFALAQLGDRLVAQEDLLQWIVAELAPLGLDIAAPGGRGGEAAICRDLPELARVSMAEVQEGRARRRSAKEQKAAAAGGSPSADTPAPAAACGAAAPGGAAAGRRAAVGLLEAVAHDPLAFDPLQGNSGHGDLFRGGLSLGASARGLARTLASTALRADLEALQALEPAGADPTALGWLLTGGAPHWTAGGLQALRLQPIGARARLTGRPRSGFGIVCGFGPAVAHFPDLAPGGVTVAVVVNDVLRGRAASAELMREALAGFGYAPGWVSPPLSVLADAARLTQSKELEPIMRSMGGIQALRTALDPSRLQAAAVGAESRADGGACGGCFAAGLRCERLGGEAEAEPEGRRGNLLKSLGTCCSTACGGARSG